MLMTPVRWVFLAGMVAFTASALFTSLLHLSRPAFVGAYGLVATAFLVAFARAQGINAATQVRRRWLAGTIGGLLVGAVLARTVLLQPGSERPDGAALAAALAWDGVVYGTIDAVLLSVLPVLCIYGARPAGELREPLQRWKWGLAALAGSLLITACYHLGFAEFRGPALVQPLLGNAIITTSYLVTGNPLAAILSHVIMHGAAVLHGMATAVQLPPHY
jgi:hypothetical protein